MIKKHQPKGINQTKTSKDIMQPKGNHFAMVNLVLLF